MPYAYFSIMGMSFPWVSFILSQSIPKEAARTAIWFRLLPQLFHNLFPNAVHDGTGIKFMAGNGDASILFRKDDNSLSAVSIAAVSIISGASPKKVSITGTGVRMLSFPFNLIGYQVGGCLLYPFLRHQLLSFPGPFIQKQLTES